MPGLFIIEKFGLNGCWTEKISLRLRNLSSPLPFLFSIRFLSNWMHPSWSFSSTSTYGDAPLSMSNVKGFLLFFPPIMYLEAMIFYFNFPSRKTMSLAGIMMYFPNTIWPLVVMNLSKIQYVLPWAGHSALIVIS